MYQTVSEKAQKKTGKYKITQDCLIMFIKTKWGAEQKTVKMTEQPAEGAKHLSHYRNAGKLKTDDRQKISLL